MRLFGRFVLILALAGVAAPLLLYQPPWMLALAAAVLIASFIVIARIAPSRLRVALLIAAFAPLSYTLYIFYLLATVISSRPASWQTYAAIGAYYSGGAALLALHAWLSRKRPS